MPARSSGKLKERYNTDAAVTELLEESFHLCDRGRILRAADVTSRKLIAKLYVHNDQNVKAEPADILSELAKPGGTDEREGIRAGGECNSGTVSGEVETTNRGMRSIRPIQEGNSTRGDIDGASDTLEKTGN
jgi:hypothetical protein